MTQNESEVCTESLGKLNLETNIFPSSFFVLFLIRDMNNSVWIQHLMSKVKICVLKQIAMFAILMANDS